MEKKIKYIEDLVNKLSDNSEINESLDNYNNAIIQLKDVKNNLNKIKIKIKNIPENNDFLQDYENYDFNDNIEKLNILLEKNKEKNITIENCLENYVYAKEIIYNSRQFINNYKSSLKQLITAYYIYDFVIILSYVNFILSVGK